MSRADGLAVMETMREKIKEYDLYTTGLVKERAKLLAQNNALKQQVKQLHRVIDKHVCGGEAMEAESSEEDSEEDSEESGEESEE